MNKLILIDGNALIHRAFHALPPFQTSKGEHVNAVYGFTSILLNILNIEHPTHIAVSFDMKGKTFRHEEYADYKATRVKAPDELYAQIPRIKEIVKAFDIPIYEMEGYEADDVLGTLAAQAEQIPNTKIYIFTGDKDTFQLITEKTHILMPTQGLKEPVIYDAQKVLGRYGIGPNQVPDMKGLQGDSSDNIKGIQGVGPKTTRTLLQKYGNLENIYKNLEEIKGNLYEKLKNGKEDAFFSRKLATIITNVPIQLNIENCKSHEYNLENITKIFLELEFKTLLKRLNIFHQHSSAVKISENQSTLF